MFYEYYRETLGYPTNVEVEAWSPAGQQFYSVYCSGRVRIDCTASDGGEARFPASAVAAYDDGQARAYASGHDLGPDEDYSERYEDDSAPYRGYADPGEDYADSDEEARYGDEIPNYDNGKGYRVQCADGMYSQSGGIQGACSGHGGVG